MNNAKRSFIVLLVVAPLLFLAGQVWSQLRTRVELVEVPVSVRDSKGKLVATLKEDDFQVSEDWRPQTITSFSVEPAPLAAAIIIDNGISGAALKRLVPRIEVLTSGFSPEDEMASFRYDHFVWKLSDFTKDPVAIRKSFSDIAKIAEARPSQGEPGAVLGGADWLRTLGGTITIGSNGAPKPHPSASDFPKSPPTSRLLHSAIFEAATALRTRPPDRRRIILIVTDGQVSGLGDQRSLDENIEFLLQNNIQLYAVATDYAIVEGRLGALASYASATGGDKYMGGSAKGMESAFTQITSQARNQYVLGYVSGNPAPRSGGDFRRILVRTRHPNQKVAHRKGYIQYPLN
jgi:VWFA-related protein